MPQYRLIDSKIKTLYVYDPSSSEETPPFVSASTTMQGARAVARPPDHPIFYLAPGEAIIQLENGRWTKLDGHALATLLVEDNG